MVGRGRYFWGHPMWALKCFRFGLPRPFVPDSPSPPDQVRGRLSPSPTEGRGQTTRCRRYLWRHPQRACGFETRPYGVVLGSWGEG